jgi:hypothetical protein
MRAFKGDFRPLVRNGIQQWTVDIDASVVANYAGHSKFVHERTHAGPGRSAISANVSGLIFTISG